MDDVRFGKPFGGGQITRQISSSHVIPRSMSGYQDFFRLSSSKEEGWLETKIGRAELWEKKWVVFDDGVLYYSTDRGANREDSDLVTKVPMDRVISLRTDDQYGDSTIQIVTTEHKLYIRAPSKDEMRRWLFCFQKSVALVLSKLLLSSSVITPIKSSMGGLYGGPCTDGNNNNHALTNNCYSNLNMTTKSSDKIRFNGYIPGMNSDTRGNIYEDDSKMWQEELEHGHGKHIAAANRRITFSDGLSQSLNPSKSINKFLCDESENDSDRMLGLGLGGGGGAGVGGRNSMSAASEAARRSVWDRSYAERSVVDLTRMNIQDVSYEARSSSSNCSPSNTWVKAMSTSATVSKSPMIPIVELTSSHSLFDPKLAGSYNDSMGRDRVMLGLSLSPPETARGRSISEGSRSSDQYDYDDGDQSQESDGDMMFDFDDADIQSRSPKGNKSSSRSGRVNRSRGNSNVSIGGKTPSDTPRQRKGTGYKSSSKAVPSVPLSGVRWSCGSCTRLGVRPSNEDRLAAIPNLIEVGLGGKGKTSQSQSLSYTSNTSNSLGNGHIRHSSNTKSQGQSQAGFSGGMGVPMSVPMISAQERHGFFAVYDGHCGAQAAIHLQETLHFTIFNHPLYYTDLQTAIQEACISTDIAFLEESRAKNQYSGTTALGAIVQGSELVVFNIGDCHAVLCCSGAALDMSDAHKPNRKDEAARILAARGWITEEKELYMARLHRMDFSEPIAREKAEQMTWTTIYRVCGEISVSRSIGDPDYKTFQPGIKKSDGFFIWPDGHDQIFMADLLIPNPECRSISLRPGHEFLIIASDGLWDVISSTEAVTRARTALALGRTASEAAEELCDLAIKLGSSDNVTTIIVQFTHN